MELKIKKAGWGRPLDSRARDFIIGIQISYLIDRLLWKIL